MAKILLVEDDSNLREIYGARLEAEGYEIIAASDGEEALAAAVRELPQLIISDVMMPKISGFDMLDILRSTPETKDVKVIVMTALSQDEDRKRGEQLGADRYIVKSQVTLDDVVVMVRELLGESTVATSAQASPAATTDDDQAITTDTAATTNLVADQPITTPLDDTTTQPVAVDPAIPPADENALNQEVEQFVATSPLMNGQLPQSTPVTPEVTGSINQEQPPVSPTTTG